MILESLELGLDTILELDYILKVKSGRKDNIQKVRINNISETVIFMPNFS
jgi:hypothetical protein